MMPESGEFTFAHMMLRVVEGVSTPVATAIALTADPLAQRLIRELATV